MSEPTNFDFEIRQAQIVRPVLSYFQSWDQMLDFLEIIGRAERRPLFVNITADAGGTGTGKITMPANKYDIGRTMGVFPSMDYTIDVDFYFDRDVTADTTMTGEIKVYSTPVMELFPRPIKPVEMYVSFKITNNDSITPVEATFRLDACLIDADMNNWDEIRRAFCLPLSRNFKAYNDVDFGMLNPMGV